MIKSRAATDWIGFKTIIIREFSRIVRIWGQTLVPPAVTATLYFVIFGSLIGRRVGQVGGNEREHHRRRLLDRPPGRVVDELWGGQ